MIKVAKFGGSSVANAKQFKKVKQIIKDDDTRRIIVTSASGRENTEDHKITDLLYLCYEHIRYGMPYESIFKIIKNKLISIEHNLKLSPMIEKELTHLDNEMKNSIDRSYLISRGEWLTAKLLSNYTGFTFVDASDILFFNFNGELDKIKSQEAFNKVMAKHKQIIVPGFYGCFPDSSIHVMSRGGSDITGSILANLASASCYENWTDVSGILKADPRIVHNPKQIDLITYDELRELSYMGASVLHEEAVYPLKDKNIPIHILNTNQPSNPGTIIMNKIKKDSQQTITGIAGKKDYSIITVVKSHMSNDFGTIRRALEVTEKFRLAVEHIPTGVDTFSLVIESESLKKINYEVIPLLKEVCQADRVSVIHEISLIAIVSRFMKNKIGTSGRLFQALGEKHINVSLISQTSDEMTIILGVKNSDYNQTIQTIYYEFEENTE